MRGLLLVLAAIAVPTAGLAQAPAGTPASVVQGLMSDDAATRTAAEAAAVQLGAPIVKPLCDLMAAGDTKSVTVAERTLFALVAAASAPGNEAERDKVVKALTAQANRPACPPAQTYALGLLALAGEPGARALGMAASRSASLVGDVSAGLRTLGELRKPEVVPVLLWALREVPGCAPAALDALAMIADPRSAVALARAADDPDETVRSAAVGALIALADAEQQRGGDLARRCYRRAYDHAVTPAQRTAGLMGLADTDPSMRVQWLLKGLADAHTRRSAHAELLEVENAELAGPLARRTAEAQGEELEALHGLAEGKGIALER